MRILRLVLGVVILSASGTSFAQMSDLPETGTGARALPYVAESVGLGAYIAAPFHSGGLSGYIWGEVGEEIDDRLNDLGIDISGEAGVLAYTVLITIPGGGGLSLSGEIDKEIGESLEEAFERNYGAGILPKISNRLSDRLVSELWLMEEAYSWFNYQGSSVGHAYFGGWSNGGINWSRGVVTVEDIPNDDPPEEMP